MISILNIEKKKKRKNKKQNYRYRKTDQFSPGGGTVSGLLKMFSEFEKGFDMRTHYCL